MINPFTKHPKSIGETYLKHMYFALIFGFTMLIGGLACIVHAIFPFLCEKTASNLLLKMTKNFIKRMPVVEERILQLNELVLEKIEQNQ